MNGMLIIFSWWLLLASLPVQKIFSMVCSDCSSMNDPRFNLETACRKRHKACIRALLTLSPQCPKDRISRIYPPWSYFVGDEGSGCTNCYFFVETSINNHLECMIHDILYYATTYDTRKQFIQTKCDYSLHNACRHRNIEMVILLVVLGVDVNEVRLEHGFTPLHYLMRPIALVGINQQRGRNNLEQNIGIIMKILRDAGAGMDIKDKYGKTANDYAIEYDYGINVPRTATLDFKDFCTIS